MSKLCIIFSILYLKKKTKIEKKKPLNVHSEIIFSANEFLARVNVTLLYLTKLLHKDFFFVQIW